VPVTDAHISVVMNTARANDSIPGFPGVDLLEFTCRWLRRQKDAPPFELVVADALYDERPRWFLDHPQPFPVKHVPGGGYWWRQGLCEISRHKNESILPARGPWIVTIDDTNVLPPWFLARCAHWFRMSLFPVAWYRDLRPGAVQADERFLAIPDGKDHVVQEMPPGQWAENPVVHGWGHVGFSLDAFLAVNGYEHWYDGGRGQEDVEFSLRLMRAGHRLVVDRRLWTGLIDQGPVAYRDPPANTVGHVVHCTSGLSPLLYEEIREGTRERANCEPFPDRLRQHLYPTCTWYCPPRQDGVRWWGCRHCGHVVVLPDDETAEDAPACPHGETMIDLTGRCRLYRDPCPHAPPGEDGEPPEWTTHHGQHPLYRERFIEHPESAMLDLRQAREALLAMPIDERPGTYAGVEE